MNDMFGGFGNGFDEPSNWTDTALICLDGHIINDSMKDQPQLNKKHCPQDGKPTISECPECHKPIAGEIHYSNVFGAHTFKLPAFCIECGKPYPWTTAKQNAAKELAKELKLSIEDQKTLETSIDQISKNDAQAQVSATKINRIMKSITSTTGEVLHKLIVDISSETAKKILLGR